MDTKKKLLVADFETTVYEGQTETEVWSACCAELFGDYIGVYHSISDFMEFLFSLKKSCVVWFHNLRFDGSFIVDYLLRHNWNYNNAKNKDMNSRDFKGLISEMNRWYSVTLKYRNVTIEFRDSVKLMPFSLAQVGEAFKTKHRKLEMEYKGYRYAGCPITPSEMQYIINDVLVLKEAMEVMINDGHDKLTIGSCCVSEFKKIIGKRDFESMFPDMKAFNLDSSYGTDTAHDYIQKSYHGGWCYLKKGSEGRHTQGRTYDVNSLYPSVMHSISGNYYPVGKPCFFKGAPPEKILHRQDIVYFVRIRCRFKLKPGYLPTIQIKRDFRYKSTEWLETSDILYRGSYHRYYRVDGEVKEAKPELTLTFRDLELLLTHYDVFDLEYIDGCYFYARLGIFDEYIDKYMQIKMNSKGAERTEAKLFLNNLYGKLSTSDDSSYRVPYISEETNALKFELIFERDKDVFYIPAGSMVTAYARYFTITHAQKNYDKFIYADTDSIHCEEGEVTDINVHDSKLLHWKLESRWSSAIFIRAKTYAEFIREHDGEKVSRPYWDIKCAGMPDRCKQTFLATHPITDFKYGLKVGGKLVPKYYPGGIVLQETDYTLHRK